MENSVNLTPVAGVQPISDLVEIIKYLKEGEVLRIEQETSPVLIRLGRGNYQMTEISRDVAKPNFYHKRYWLPYSVPLNALIAYNVYLDREYHENAGNQFSVGDIVQYTSRRLMPDGITYSSELDIAYVLEVYTDGTQFFYKLSGSEHMYEESSLRKSTEIVDNK